MLVHLCISDLWSWREKCGELWLGNTALYCLLGERQRIFIPNGTLQSAQVRVKKYRKLTPGPTRGHAREGQRPQLFSINTALWRWVIFRRQGECERRDTCGSRRRGAERARTNGWHAKAASQPAPCRRARPHSPQPTLGSDKRCCLSNWGRRPLAVGACAVILCSHHTHMLGRGGSDPRSDPP